MNTAGLVFIAMVPMLADGVANDERAAVLASTVIDGLTWW